MSEKVNCIDKAGKWIVCGFQNAKLCIYELGKANGHPIAECKPSKSGVIKGAKIPRNLTKFSFSKIIPEISPTKP